MWPLFFWQITTPKTKADFERRTRSFRTIGMIERHPYSGRQVATDLGSQIHRGIEDSERCPIEPGALGPRSNKSNHLNWEMLTIWSFVVFSFAALFFAGYVIWAKCQVR
jgi:hypothetical protein